MRKLIKSLCVVVSTMLLGAAAAPAPEPIPSAPPDGISLMKTLAEWKYPGSNMPNGASMSDGGTPPVQAVKCAVVLTTPDPIEKVIAFYDEKLKAGKQPGQAEPTNAVPNAVSVQDDSKGRPVTLRVFVVNRGDTSTALVISRAEGEKETHIAWSHYIRLDAAERPAARANDAARVVGEERPR